MQNLLPLIPPMISYKNTTRNNTTSSLEKLKPAIYLQLLTSAVSQSSPNVYTVEVAM